MGMWGLEPFDNDTAADLAAKVIVKTVAYMTANGAEEMWIENVTDVGQELGGQEGKL